MQFSTITLQATIPDRTHTFTTCLRLFKWLKCISMCLCIHVPNSWPESSAFPALSRYPQEGLQRWILSVPWKISGSPSHSLTNLTEKTMQLVRYEFASCVRWWPTFLSNVISFYRLAPQSWPPAPLSACCFPLKASQQWLPTVSTLGWRLQGVVRGIAL